MNFLVSCCRAVLLAAVLLLPPGCTPPESGQSDDEKDPHFLAGKNRVSAMDYIGAIESFNRCLQANPKSAMAHFELGWLYDRKQGDPAAAIYHYENYLKLRPKAENAAIVRQLVLACKQELARTVSLGPVTEKQQRDLERMAEENKRLTEENKKLGDEILKLRIALAAQNAAGETASGSTPPAQTGTPQPKSGDAARPSGSPSQSQPAASQKSSPVRTGTYRAVHRVKAGETFSSIARRYAVRVESLQAANPGVDAKRLRPGRELNIP